MSPPFTSTGILIRMTNNETCFRFIKLFSILLCQSHQQHHLDFLRSVYSFDKTSSGQVSDVRQQERNFSR